ncbi:MAG: MotA/TolQ/ExbB proton channel family protein, partial [Muribaculaceae bacterium]|nr:MotA/TolQ/ExbB proton channel family protein [Muribaculaceae bacterium]
MAKPVQGGAPVKSKVAGVKNAFLVIVACFIVAVCAFLFFFGAPSHFEFEGEAPASMWFFEGEAHPSDIIGTIFMGGIIVPVLQTLFLTVIVLSVERAIALKSAKGSGNIAKFVSEVKAKLAKNDIAGAQELCRKQKGSVAAVVSAALVRYEEMDKNTVLTKEQKVQTLQKEVEEATAMEMPSLQQNLPIVATLTTLGTLVGLLGTVIGMIKSFQALSASGAPDSTALSTGISEALVNTAFGIAT